MSTWARAPARLVIGGQPMTGLQRRRRAPYFRRIQMIHQDPYSALNRSQQPPLGHLGGTEQQHACPYPKRRSVVAVPAGPGTEVTCGYG